MKALIKTVTSTRIVVCAALIGACSIGIIPAINSTAFAQEYGCIGNFADTWVIHTATPNVAGLQIKANDALNVFCDNKKAQYVIELYSVNEYGKSERKAICPGNAQITVNNNTPVLICSFWDGSANVVKNLSIELLNQALPKDTRSIEWSLTTETTNGVISGRPESGVDTGGSTGGNGA